MEFMGLCRALDAAQAEALRSQLDEGWAVAPDDDQHLRLRRAFRTRNFTSALELCNRIGDVAEAVCFEGYSSQRCLHMLPHSHTQEGHHPDLHIESWNRLRVEVWTHSIKGLTENDFILASKIDALDMEGLLSKKKTAS